MCLEICVRLILSKHSPRLKLKPTHINMCIKIFPISNQTLVMLKMFVFWFRIRRKSTQKHRLSPVDPKFCCGCEYNNKIKKTYLQIRKKRHYHLNLKKFLLFCFLMCIFLYYSLYIANVYLVNICIHKCVYRYQFS